jgi:CheY-like chemotaxis protein/HPt (histidine-containing phosphotransfer) domain-containing protein
MPEIDGLMLAGEIRRARTASELPIVMLSSLGPRESRLDAIELAAYLLKPIKPSHLYDALVSIFGGEAAVAAIKEPAQFHFDADMGKRHPLSILLAEDNATNQKLALLVLERLGYRADVAANGIEVLQALRRQHYDVVLMDVQMPEMDGLEATRVIGREFRDPRRPRIVAMTANALREDRDECFAAGMDDFIAKPIQLAELVAALNKCQARAAAELGERGAQEAAPPTPILQVGTLPLATPGVGICQEMPTTAASEPSPPVLDPAALQRLRNTLGRQADVMLPGLMEGFFKDAPGLIADARRSWEQGQPAEVRRAAHTLKSSSATFGAMALSVLARELEYRARDGVLDGVAELLARIETQFEKAKAALQAYRKEP